MLVFDRNKYVKSMKKIIPYIPTWIDKCDGLECKNGNCDTGKAIFGIVPSWCTELKEESKMELRYKGEGAKALTKGVTYSAKFDSTGQLRVKGDDGRWSKYGVQNFDVVSVTQEDMAMLTGITAHQSVQAVEPIPQVSSTTEVPETLKPKKSASSITPQETQEKFEQAKEEVKNKINTMEAPPMKKKVTLRSYLESQGVISSLLDDLTKFRQENGVDDSVKDRIAIPSTLYKGGKIWTQAIAALLEGKHILLQGEKATGKNVFAGNLSFAFGRPMWDVSFHTHMDASGLIGSETFKNNEVVFRPGAVYQCAQFGGFGVLDEINMAKPEASAVLHSVLDDRRVIDVPGYEKIKLNDATRFIATMNYGYAGTRELNEALTSRFVVIHVPSLSTKELTDLLSSKYPKADRDVLELYALVFDDLQKKAENAEISTKCVDLRGILSALGMTERGLRPLDALEACITNKAFEKYERDIVRDVVGTRIPESWDKFNIFPAVGSVTVNFGGK